MYVVIEVVDSIVYGIHSTTGSVTVIIPGDVSIANLGNERNKYTGDIREKVYNGNIKYLGHRL